MRFKRVAREARQIQEDHVVAVRRGREDLWLYFPSAGSKFRIAVAGPAVTLWIGAMCISRLRGAAQPGGHGSGTSHGSDTSTSRCSYST